ncbi:MAG: SiaB family protein kinase [Salibacteraceae bacterium]
MSATEIKVGTNYMQFIYKFHETMEQQKLQLVYNGEVNQSITKAFVSLAEKNLDETNESLTTKRRVYHVMVECLQNICKHADDPVTGEPDIPGSGIFVVGYNENAYIVTTGNIVANERIEGLTHLLERVNHLDRDELKKLYKEQIKQSRLSDKGGAGLGFIDIAKKTGNKLIYHFEPVNDVSSFFILKTKISKS